MKPQSIQQALPTEALFLAMEDLTTLDESKLRLTDCVPILLQLTVSLGACGLLHWVMT